MAQYTIVYTFSGRHSQFYIKKQMLMSCKQQVMSEQSGDGDGGKVIKVANKQVRFVNWWHQPQKLKRTNKQKYHWKESENKKYFKFLSKYRTLFDLPSEEKKKIGIYRLMSEFVKSRDLLQCQSHHQKILKKYGGLDQAIASMSSGARQKGQVKCIVEEEREYIFYKENLDVRGDKGHANESNPEGDRSSGGEEEQLVVKVEEDA